MSRDAKRVRRWPESALVYDARSGDVHQLSNPHADLLLELENAPADPSRIALYRALNLVDNQADISDEDLLDIVRIYQEQFAHAGLLT